MTGNDLSAVKTLQEIWNDLTQKFRNLTAEYSNNSSSKAGDATTPLLGSN
jgi:hypothetical protein